MPVTSCVVIDDNFNDRIFFGQAIDEAGDETLYYPFLHIDEALTIPNGVIQASPDFIFMDLRMTLSSGIRRLKRLKAIKQYSNVPVCLYSDTKMDVLNSSFPGASHYFVLPKSIKLLADILRPILRKKVMPFLL